MEVGIAQDKNNIKSTVEGLLLVCSDGISISEIQNKLSIPKIKIQSAMQLLIQEYDQKDGGVLIRNIHNQYQFVTNPKIHDDIKNFLQTPKKNSISKATLETLTIIAYKQPITNNEIEEIRGSYSKFHITKLLSKQLIQTAGQKQVPGKPMLYTTTKEFLKYFGLNSIQELPPLKEIKEMNLEEIG